MIEDQVCVIHIENGIRQIPLEDEEGEGARAVMVLPSVGVAVTVYTPAFFSTLGL